MDKTNYTKNFKMLCLHFMISVLQNYKGKKNGIILFFKLYFGEIFYYIQSKYNKERKNNGTFFTYISCLIRMFIAKNAFRIKDQCFNFYITISKIHWKQKLKMCSTNVFFLFFSFKNYNHYFEMKILLLSFPFLITFRRNTLSNRIVYCVWLVLTVDCVLCIF